MNAPRPEWCEDHGQTKPCTGCRADELAARGEQAATLRAQGVPRWRIDQLLAEHGVTRDVRQIAAGEDRDDDD